MFVANCLIFGSKSWRSFHWIGCTLMKFNLFFIFLILSHAILLSSIFYLDYCQWKGHQVKACRSFPLRTFVQAVLFNKHNLLVPGNIQFLLHQALNDFWLTSPLLPLVSPWHTSLRFFQLGSPYSLQRLYCILILPHRFGSSFLFCLQKSLVDLAITVPTILILFLLAFKFIPRQLHSIQLILVSLQLLPCLVLLFFQNVVSKPLSNSAQVSF